MAPKAKKKIVIELLPVRVKIGKATKQAQRSIKKSQAAIAKAKQDGRLEDAKKGTKKLKKAVIALASLKKANMLMNAACCNQQFNCDPI